MDSLLGIGTSSTTHGVPRESIDLVDKGGEEITSHNDPILPEPVRTTQWPQFPSLGRKRTRDDIPSYSSDPPMFSSDDLPPGLENYDSHRSKKQYQGPWWGNRLDCPPIRKKREFKRNIDSAVWMDSDETETTDDDDLDIEAAFSSGLSRTGKIGNKMQLEIPSQDSYSLLQPDLPGPEELAQREAARIVQDCVDDGCEVIDLS